MHRLPRGQLYFAPVVALRSAARHLPRGWTAGRPVAELESALAHRLGRAHAVLLPHARVGLHHVLQALGLNPGAEVATTPVTVPGMVQAIQLAGLVPRFVDLGVQTANFDPTDLARQLSPATAAILVTHLCGFAADLRAATDLATASGLPLVEDGSQALGASLDGRPIGAWGVAGVFSLSTMKPVSSFHGGVVVTDDDALAREIRAVDAVFCRPPSRREAMTTVGGWLLRDHALHLATHPQVFPMTWPFLRAAERWAPGAVDAAQRGRTPGRPSPVRMQRLLAVPDGWRRPYSDFQATLALDALPKLDAGNARRQELGLRLVDRLTAAGVAGTPVLLERSQPVFWRFPLWVQDVPRFRSRLAAMGVDSGQTNLDCCSESAAFGGRPGLAPQAASFVRDAVLLPMHPNLRATDMDRIARAVLRSVS